MRQNEMNKLAYDECKARWMQVREADNNGTPMNDAARALSKRVANRAELKLVITQPDAVKKMPPGSFVAMGTSGLKPTELRAVLHALIHCKPKRIGRPAVCVHAAGEVIGLA